MEISKLQPMGWLIVSVSKVLLELLRNKENKEEKRVWSFSYRNFIP